MEFLNGPSSLFKRLRVLVGGQSCEYIDEYARTCEMFDIIQSSSVRKHDSVEGVRAGEILASTKSWWFGIKLQVCLAKKRFFGISLCSFFSSCCCQSFWKSFWIGLKILLSTIWKSFDGPFENNFENWFESLLEIPFGLKVRLKQNHIESPFEKKSFCRR